MRIPATAHMRSSLNLTTTEGVTETVRTREGGRRVIVIFVCHSKELLRKYPGGNEKEPLKRIREIIKQFDLSKISLGAM